MSHMIRVAEAQREMGLSNAWIHQPANKYKKYLVKIDKIFHIDKIYLYEYVNTAEVEKHFRLEMGLFVDYLLEQGIVSNYIEIGKKIEPNKKNNIGLFKDSLLHRRIAIKIFVKFRGYLPAFYEWKGYSSTADTREILEALHERIGDRNE